MSERNAIRRLRSFAAGRPLPVGSTRHFHVAQDRDLLIVAFLRMGGESRPWAIAWGHPDEDPTVLAVPEARNRDLVGEMCAEFAPALLAHLRTPGFVGVEPLGAGELQPLRQVWLPNDAHLEMLDHLAYAYAFTRWETPLLDTLKALGRAAGWLFRESWRPGQQTAMVATHALRDAYAFPAEDLRQGHLGFLLAWLTTDGDRTARIDAAITAEQRSMSTSLDPDLERSILGRLVEQWHAAVDERDDGADALRDQIVAVLSDQARHRWELTRQAVEALRADTRRPNAGVSAMVTEAARKQWYDFTRKEAQLIADPDHPPFIPSNETDRHGAGAAASYFGRQQASDLFDHAFVHDDAELLAELIEDGMAFRGEIVDVRDVSAARAMRPVWTVRDVADRQIRLRTGASVEVVGFAKREGTIRGFSNDEDGWLLIEVEITGAKTSKANGPPPHDGDANSPSLIGKTVAMVPGHADFARLKIKNIWNSDTPGGWLTHAVPGGTLARVDAEDNDDVAVLDLVGGDS